MLDWAILFLLCGEVFLVANIDRKLFGVWLTPFNLLAIPYTVVVILAFFFAPTFGFIPLYMESVLVWIVGLFVFRIGGLFPVLLIGNPTQTKYLRTHFINYERRSKYLVLLLSWVSIVIMFFGLIQAIGLVGGLKDITSNRFAETFGSGLSGHFMVLSLPLLIYLIGVVRRNTKFIQLTIIMLFAMLFMYQAKSRIMLPMIGGGLYRSASGRLNVSIKQLILFSFLGYIVFNITYLIGFGANSIDSLFDSYNYEALLRHFWFYTFAGVLAFGETFRVGVAGIHSDYRMIFTPFWNIYALIYSKELLNNVGDYFVKVDLVRSLSSNVNTLFGTLVIHLHYFGYVIYTFFLGMIVYTIFVLSKIKNQSWLVVLWSFFATLLLFGWFEFYFWHLAIVEVTIYCLIIAFIVKIFPYKQQKR